MVTFSIPSSSCSCRALITITVFCFTLVVLWCMKPFTVSLTVKTIYPLNSHLETIKRALCIQPKSDSLAKVLELKVTFLKVSYFHRFSLYLSHFLYLVPTVSMTKCALNELPILLMIINIALATYLIGYGGRLLYLVVLTFFSVDYRCSNILKTVVRFGCFLTQPLEIIFYIFLFMTIIVAALILWKMVVLGIRNTNCRSRKRRASRHYYSQHNIEDPNDNSDTQKSILPAFQGYHPGSLQNRTKRRKA